MRMTEVGFGSIVLMVFAVLVAGCGKDESSNSEVTTGTGGMHSGAGGGGSGGTSSVATSNGGKADATGGTSTTPPPLASVRFLQTYVRDGKKKSYDLWAKNPDYTWISLLRGLEYGQLTDYFDVPIAWGSNTSIWYLPPGSNTKDYEICIACSLKLMIDSTSVGRHTMVMFDQPMPVDYAAVTVRDDSPTMTPPTGYAYVAFITQGIQDSVPVMDYAYGASCIARDTQASYQPIPLGAYPFRIHSGDGASNCQGAEVMTTSTITLGEGDVWLMVAMGDPSIGYELRPVKMTRN